MAIEFNFSRAYLKQRMKKDSFRRMITFLLLFTLLFPCLSISLLDEYFMESPPRTMLGVDAEFEGVKYEYTRRGGRIEGLKFYIGDDIYHAHDYVIAGDVREMYNRLNSELRGKTYSIYYRESSFGKKEVLGVYCYGDMYIDPAYAVNGFREMAAFWFRFSGLWLVSGLIVAVFASGMIRIKRAHSSE